MSSPLDFFRLTQCYYCLSYDHIKTNCPYTSELRRCARCGNTGHATTICQNPTHCLHCGGPHPATARCCPRYQAIFLQKYQELSQMILKQSQTPSLQSISGQYSSISSPEREPLDNSWSKIQRVAAAAETQNDFIGALFTLARSSTPEKSYNAKENSELDFSQKDIREACKITFEEDKSTVSELTIEEEKKTGNTREKLITGEKLITEEKLITGEKPIIGKKTTTGEKSIIVNYYTADTEKYVLPADGSEWAKLFYALRLRLVSTELSVHEKSEGEGLLPYQDVISYLPHTEQVIIFQQLCLLTDTVETAD